MWLVFVTDNVNITYKDYSNMRIPQMQFTWVQIGEEENQDDLYINGVLDEPG